MAQEVDPKALRRQVRLYRFALWLMAVALLIVGFGAGLWLIGGHPIWGGVLVNLGLAGFFYGLTVHVEERYSHFPAVVATMFWAITIVLVIYGALANIR